MRLHFWSALTFGMLSFIPLQIGSVGFADEATATRPAPAEALKLDTTKASPKGESSVDRPRMKPLPTHFGMLGVSEKQRLELLKVQDSYEPQMQKLREELKRLVRERDQKLESLLTDGQALRLKEIRTEALSEQNNKKAARAEKK